MAKEDTVSGLLSKVVKFVRNPATNWADLDSKDTGREEALSKQLLKEMIERKRRNDFVRKREFDMLRKMRKREAMTGQDPGARPSFFPQAIFPASSLTSLAATWAVRSCRSRSGFSSTTSAEMISPGMAWMTCNTSRTLSPPGS